MRCRLHRRRGFALFLVLSLGTLLLLITLALFSHGKDVWTQASRAEGRLVLLNLLKSAADEGWWLAGHPGLYPPPPRPADMAPVRFYRALRAGDGQASERLETPLTAALATLDPRLVLQATTVSVRAQKRTGRLGQGLVELRVTGRYEGDRTTIDLTLIQVRGFLRTGSAVTPRVELLAQLVAQSVEER